MRPGESLRRLREERPLVHQITNYVVMNETANATLALGALPVMAHAPEEVEEMVGLAGALVLNIGTLSSQWVDSMLSAGGAANDRGVNVVVDDERRGERAEPVPTVDEFVRRRALEPELNDRRARTHGALRRGEVLDERVHSHAKRARSSSAAGSSAASAS